MSGSQESRQGEGTGQGTAGTKAGVLGPLAPLKAKQAQPSSLDAGVGGGLDHMADLE